MIILCIFDFYGLDPFGKVVKVEEGWGDLESGLLADNWVAK